LLEVIFVGLGRLKAFKRHLASCLHCVAILNASILPNKKQEEIKMQNTCVYIRFVRKKTSVDTPLLEYMSKKA